MPDLSIWQWLAGASCAFAIGVAKTGMPGIAIFVVPSMVLMVGDARESAGWLLPILCLADVFAVYYWRRHADVKQLVRLAPWVLVGMAAGAAALFLDESILRKMVGVIVLFMLGIYLLRKMRAAALMIPHHPAPYGATAGFATTVANAAGSVMNLYLLGMNLPKHEFIGTGAWFFFIINLAKVPIYQYHGLFSQQSLAFDAAMIPAVIGGAVTGRWIFEHIPQRAFETMIVILTVIATAALFR